MKSLHFCTELLLKHIKSGKTPLIFTTARTGWILEIYEGDTVKINERDDRGKDTFLMYAQCVNVGVKTFEKLSFSLKEEVKRYKKKFKPGHLFQVLTFRKIRYEL